MFDANNNNFKTYYHLFLRNKALFFVPFVVVFSVVALSFFFFPKVYESTTVIRIQKEQPNPIGTERVVREDIGSQLRSLKETILSRTSLLGAVRELRLDKGISTNAERELLLESISKRIKVASKGAGLFSISFQDRSPEKAMAFTETLSSIFIDKNLSLKRREAFSSVDFIRKQLEIYKEKLETSEESLRKYKLAHIDEMPGEVNTNLVQLQKLRDSLASTTLAVQEAQGKKELIKKQLTGEKPMVVSMITGEATSTEEKIKVLEFQLSQLLANYTEKHPDIIRIRSELKKLREEAAAQPEGEAKTVPPQTGELTTLNPLHQKLKEELNNIQINIGTLTHKKQIVERQIAGYEEKVRSIPNQEKELASLQRDYNVNEKIYQMLLMKLEEARISKQLEVNEGGTRFQVIDPANLPALPVKPQRLRFLSAALAFGLAAGIGSIIVKEYFDTSTRGVQEAEDVYRVPVVATVPVISTLKEIRQKKRQHRRWVFSSLFFILGLVGAVVFALFHSS